MRVSAMKTVSGVKKRKAKKRKMSTNSRFYKYFLKILNDGQHSHMTKYCDNNKNEFQVKFTNKKSKYWKEIDISLFKDLDLLLSKNRPQEKYEEMVKVRFKSNMSKLIGGGFLEKCGHQKISKSITINKYRILELPSDTEKSAKSKTHRKKDSANDPPNKICQNMNEDMNVNAYSEPRDISEVNKLIAELSVNEFMEASAHRSSLSSCENFLENISYAELSANTANEFMEANAHRSSLSSCENFLENISYAELSSNTANEYINASAHHSNLSSRKNFLENVGYVGLAANTAVQDVNKSVNPVLYGTFGANDNCAGYNRIDNYTDQDVNKSVNPVLYGTFGANDNCVGYNRSDNYMVQDVNKSVNPVLYGTFGANDNCAGYNRIDNYMLDEEEYIKDDPLLSSAMEDFEGNSKGPNQSALTDDENWLTEFTEF